MKSVTYRIEKSTRKEKTMLKRILQAMAFTLAGIALCWLGVTTAVNLYASQPVIANTAGVGGAVLLTTALIVSILLLTAGPPSKS